MFDFRHRVGDGDARQARATLEGMFSDFRHRIRDYDARQASATLEDPTSNSCRSFGKNSHSVLDFVFCHSSMRFAYTSRGSIDCFQFRAFSGCAGLTTASVLGPVKLMNGTFEGCTALECVTLGVGIKKIIMTDDDDKEEARAFGNCSALKTINVPAKKADYYKSRLPEELHSLIVELPAEKKAKKK